MSNNSSVSLTLSISDEALSLFYLSHVWPANVILIFDTLANTIIAIFLLIVFSKWQVYTGDLMFLLRCHLSSEITLNMTMFLLSMFHVVNFVLGRSESMKPATCFLFAGVQIPLVCLSRWFTVFIACDRFMAIVKPASLESRWLCFTTMYFYMISM